MTLTISNDSRSTRLWNVQESGTDTEANVIVVSLFSTDPGETFLLPLTASDEGTPNGLATANRLGGIGSLANWVSELESYADGTMGSLTLSDDQRGRSIPGQLRSVSWSVESGAPHEVEYSLEFVRGRDLGFDFGGGSSGPESVSPSSSASLAGYDLGEITNYRVTREQDITEIEIPQFLGDVSLDDNLAFSTGGVTRTFRIEGRKTGSDSALADFEQTMQSNMADTLNTVSYSEAFPGRNLDVAIQNYSGSRRAGEDRILEYSLELIEGQQLGDLDIYDELSS